MAKIICKAVNYSLIVQDDKIVILNIPTLRKALPDQKACTSEHAINKKMVHGLLMVTLNRVAMAEVVG